MSACRDECTLLAVKTSDNFAMIDTKAWEVKDWYHGVRATDEISTREGQSSQAQSYYNSIILQKTLEI